MERRSLRSLAVAGLLLTAGCTGGADEPAGSPSPPAPDPEEPVRVVTTVSRVAGSLPPAGRAAVAQELGEVVSGYLDGAFAGAGPGGDFSAAFADFTAGAAARAQQDLEVLTARGLAGAGELTAGGAAYVAVLAPRGEAVGATARLKVSLIDERGGEPAGALAGRLLLTPSARGWRVFGYDLVLTPSSGDAAGGS